MIRQISLEGKTKDLSRACYLNTQLQRRWPACTSSVKLI